MKRNQLIIFGLFILILTSFFAFKYFINPRQPVRPIREKRQLVDYSYYVIVDQATGKTLMTVSTGRVEAGDELITETNRRYVVVRVKGNKAYAKYMETVKINKSPSS